jgi:NAD-dependent deacetylase
MLKDDIVFFGESVPKDKVRKSYELALEANLALCLGSSLLVRPANLIPYYTYKNKGIVSIIK